jgi:hypothetical protein
MHNSHECRSLVTVHLKKALDIIEDVLIDKNELSARRPQDVIDCVDNAFTFQRPYAPPSIAVSPHLRTSMSTLREMTQLQLAHEVQEVDSEMWSTPEDRFESGSVFMMERDIINGSERFSWIFQKMPNHTPPVAQADVADSRDKAFKWLKQSYSHCLNPATDKIDTILTGWYAAFVNDEGETRIFSADVINEAADSRYAQRKNPLKLGAVESIEQTIMRERDGPELLDFLGLLAQMSVPIRVKTCQSFDDIGTTLCPAFSAEKFKGAYKFAMPTDSRSHLRDFTVVVAGEL